MLNAPFGINGLICLEDLLRVSHLRHDFHSSNLACSIRDVFHDYFEIDIGKCDANTVFGRMMFVQRMMFVHIMFIFQNYLILFVEISLIYLH